MRDIARQHRDAVARRSASIHELPALPGCRSDLYLVLEETKRSCFYDVLIVIRGNGCRYNGARWGSWLLLRKQGPSRGLLRVMRGAVG